MDEWRRTSAAAILPFALQQVKEPPSAVKSSVAKSREVALRCREHNVFPAPHREPCSIGASSLFSAPGQTEHLVRLLFAKKARDCDGKLYERCGVDPSHAVVVLAGVVGHLDRTSRSVPADAGLATRSSANSACGAPGLESFRKSRGIERQDGIPSTSRFTDSRERG
jgi:hypothetical protein